MLKLNTWYLAPEYCKVTPSSETLPHIYIHICIYMHVSIIQHVTLPLRFLVCPWLCIAHPFWGFIYDLYKCVGNFVCRCLGCLVFCVISRFETITQHISGQPFCNMSMEAWELIIEYSNKPSNLEQDKVAWSNMLLLAQSSSILFSEPPLGVQGHAQKIKLGKSSARPSS